MHCWLLKEAEYTKVTAINFRIALVFVCFGAPRVQEKHTEADIEERRGT